MDGNEGGWRRQAWPTTEDREDGPVVRFDGRVTDADFADPPPRGADGDDDWPDTWPDAGPAPDAGPDGRPLYAGRPGRDPYARGGGYRRASDDRWAAIREAYLAGEPGASVAARFGLARSTLYARAREEGWLRQDQAEAPPLAPGWADEPVDLEAETTAGLPDYGVLATHALVRMQRAVLNGRAMEAGRWLRLHTRLTALAAQSAAETEPPARPAAPAPALAPARKTPDPHTAALSRMRTVQTLARAAASLNLDDSVGRILLNKSLAILDALDPPPDPAPAPVSDTSDNSDSSDTVFPPAPPP